MAYQFPLEGGRINASVGGNSTSAGAGYSLVSTGTLLLAGGNNVTLSQNGASISIAGPTLSNSNGFTFGSNGSVVTASYAGGGSINLSASNTSANLASVTFSNSNGVSFGLNAGVVTASHNGITSQSNQALSASNGSFAFQTAGFSNANGVTFGTSAGSIMTASVNTSYAASNHSHGNPTLNLTNISGTTASASNGLTLSLSAAAQSVQTQSNIQGIIASGSTNRTGDISFANSNGVTFGLSNNTITASVSAPSGGVALYDGTNNISSGTARVSATGALTASINGQTLNLSAPGQSNLSATGAVSISNNGNTISIGAPAFSAGVATNSTVSNQFILTGGNNVTLSQSTGAGGATVTINAGGGGVALYDGAGSISSGTARFSNTNGVSFGFNGQTVTASVNTSYAASNHSHGNPTLNLTNISGTTASASNGLTLSLSAASQSAQTQSNIQGVIASGSTNYTGNISFANSNGVTFGLSNNTVTASVAAGGGGVALANSQTAFTSGTVNLLEGGGAITIASTTGQKYNFSVPAQSSLSATGALSISRNASTISIGAPAFSAGMSNIGNTSGTSGTASNQIIFAGGNNITLSQSTGAGGNTISIIGGAGGGGGGGVALSANAMISSGTASLAAAGALTASVNGQTLSLSVPAQSSLSVTGALSLSNNGSTISIGAPAMSSLVATGGISISTTGSTINIGTLARSIDFYQNMDRGTTATIAVPFASLMLQRLNQENDVFAANITANTVLLNLTANATATNLSNAHTMSVSIGIYSDNVTNLSLINSASSSWALAANTSNSTAYHGPRWLSFVSSQWSSAPAFSQGGDYVFGVIARTSGVAPALSYYGQNYMISNQRSGSIGAAGIASTTMAQGNYWNAVMATTSLPSVISASQVNRNNASAIFMPHIILNNRYSGTF